MAKLTPDSRIDKKSRDRGVEAFVKNLSTEHKMLIVLKAQLYGGRWEPMQKDLENRLEGRPYIFKLANRINDDIERIKQMRQFEDRHKVNLADYVGSLE